MEYEDVVRKVVGKINSLAGFIESIDEEFSYINSLISPIVLRAEAHGFKNMKTKFIVEKPSIGLMVGSNLFEILYLESVYVEKPLGYHDFVAPVKYKYEGARFIPLCAVLTITPNLKPVDKESEECKKIFENILKEYGIYDVVSEPISKPKLNESTYPIHVLYSIGNMIKRGLRKVVGITVILGDSKGYVRDYLHIAFVGNIVSYNYHKGYDEYGVPKPLIDIIPYIIDEGVSRFIRIFEKLS